MNRRDFLKLIVASGVAYEMDWEKLLWVPGEKKIFLPPEVAFLDYNIAVPMFRNIIYTGWDVPEDKLEYKLINREQAIKNRVLIPGQGLEDIDRWIKDMKALEGKK